MIKTKIIKISQLKPIISSIKRSGKSIVLTGGCFDILHIGHIKFMNHSKKENEILIVLLENDTRVKNLKGLNRPYFKQIERAQVLSSLQQVDFVILLPAFTHDCDYEKLINGIQPNFISITSNDPILSIKQYQAKKSGSKMRIIPYIKTHSSSRIARLLGIE
jgi:FAD synthetase